MKTPKRYPVTMSVYASKNELHEDRARWHRKNRIRQLKNTIARLAAENYALNAKLQAPGFAYARAME